MKDRTRKIIVAVLLVIAVCCAGYLIWYYATAAKTKQSYDDAKKLSTENVKPSKTNSDDGEQTKPEIPVDFTALQEKNPDIYAWIKIDGTTVDYPVCQNNEDDNYYLSHTWERVEAADGAIFTQACNSKNFTDFNTVIYGHQMGEGVDTMFHTLDRYLEEGYIEKYPNVIIYTPDHVLTYRIFAAVIYDDRHLINSFNYVMDDQRQAFLDSLQDSRDLRSRYSDIESVGTEDRILSLSTCVTGESNHRLLVEAVLTNEELKSGNRDTCSYLRRAVGRCRLYGYKREKRYAEKTGGIGRSGCRRNGITVRNHRRRRKEIQTQPGYQDRSVHGC